MQTEEVTQTEEMTLSVKTPPGPQDLTLLPSDLPHVEACVSFAADWIDAWNFQGHSLKRLAPLRSICRRRGVKVYAGAFMPRDMGAVLLQHKVLGWYIFYPARASGKGKARAVCQEVGHLSLITSRDSPLLAVPKERQWRVLDAARRRVAGMLVRG